MRALPSDSSAKRVSHTTPSVYPDRGMALLIGLVLGTLGAICRMLSVDVRHPPLTTTSDAREAPNHNATPWHHAWHMLHKQALCSGVVVAHKPLADATIKEGCKVWALPFEAWHMKPSWKDSAHHGSIRYPVTSFCVGEQAYMPYTLFLDGVRNDFKVDGPSSDDTIYNLQCAVFAMASVASVLSLAPDPLADNISRAARARYAPCMQQSPCPILLDRELVQLPPALLAGAPWKSLKRDVALGPLQISSPLHTLVLRLEGGRIGRDCSTCSANDCCTHWLSQHAFMSAWCSRMPLSPAWRDGYFPCCQAHLEMVDATFLMASKDPLKAHGWVTQWSGFESIMPTVPASWLDAPCALLLGILELFNLLAFLLASLQRDRKRLRSGAIATLLLLHSLAPAVQANPVAVEERAPPGGAGAHAGGAATGSATPTSSGDRAMVANVSPGPSSSARPLLEPRGSTAASSAWQAPSPPRLLPRSMPPPAVARRLQSTTTVRTVAELTAAVADASIGRILLAAGTYAFSSGTVCSSGSDDPSALCISRDVSLEALEPGTVVLDAQGTSSSRRRVMRIDGGTVGLIGLNITGGYASYVSGLGVALRPSPECSPACPRRSFPLRLLSTPSHGLNIPRTFLERPRSKKLP